MIKRFLPLIPLCVFAAATHAGPAGNAGWPAYGGDAGGSRYSALTQITPKNVRKLKVAWTFRTGELGNGVREWDRYAFEATPVFFEGALYLTTPTTNVIAVDAATGKLRWRHDSASIKQAHYSDGVSRGVSLWVDAKADAGAPCAARIFAPTLDGRLLALDADDGKPCTDFGAAGTVDLLAGVNAHLTADSESRDYLVTSPPAILDDKVIVGSSIGDNRSVEEELGIVRAFDARTGRLIWSWDPIPRKPSDPAYADWRSDQIKSASAANAWAPLSVDRRRHLVFVPTGSASPDFFGGVRVGDNRWANSVVALDGATGKLVWGRQLVHHDLWDYDTPSQPTLGTVVHDGKAVDAVLQATKTGFIYTLNRETGEPVFPIEERPVPHGGVHGEVLSPTQPYPVAPPPLVRQEPITEDDAWGVAWFDTRSCRKRIAASRSEGIFTPPSTQESIMQPGNAGGMNWGGIAFDQQRQIVVANAMNLPWLVALLPRNQVRDLLESGRYEGYEIARQRGTPYAMARRPFLSPLGIPCVKPPWGTLTAVDISKGVIKWSIPLGDTPYVHLNWGTINLGGPIVTASGLIFISASIDDRLRAFSTETGKMLWKTKLPAGGQATPMTYSANGRQYVVIAAGGYKDASKRGDYLVAYALP
ncbi:MAG: pyrroloquinoline quinone-dependent dehydrogenase [Lysobacterales bacterium]|jgi:quinoprotein glucose dehydrogenase